MSTYKLYAPIALTAENFSDFVALLRENENETLNPDHIGGFAEKFNECAYVPVPEPKSYVMRNPDIDGAYLQALMWTAKDGAGDDMTKKALLFMDIFPNGKNDDGSPKFRMEPRQYILGAGAQCVIPYKMSCCPGLSALAVFKQGGEMHPDLLENPKFVKGGNRDLFGLLSDDDNQGIRIDRDGGILDHWYKHVMHLEHSCHSHAKISIPPRLRRFTPK